MLDRQANLTKAVSASGRGVPKRPAGFSVSPVTSARTNMDVKVEESGPVSVEKNVVREAEELKHVPAPVLAFQSRSGGTQRLSFAI